MSDLENKFNAVVQEVQERVKQGDKPTNSMQIELKLYALYKQATQGDIDVAQPGITEFRARAKWNAWNAIKGKDKDQCKQDYIDLCESLRN